LTLHAGGSFKEYTSIDEPPATLPTVEELKQTLDAEAPGTRKTEPFKAHQAVGKEVRFRLHSPINSAKPRRAAADLI